MGITMTTTGRSGKPGRLSFFPIRAHLLTTSSSQASYPSTHRKAAGLAHYAAPPLPTKQALRGSPVRRWYPSLRSGRALCEADRALCGERQTMPPSLRASVVIVCAAGRRLSPPLHLRCKSLSPSGTTCHPPAKTCRRQLYRRDGRCFSAPSIFFCLRQKKQKRLPAGSRKDVIHYGDLSSGS